ncbi:hypothetical protein FRC07_006135 [Ceratobasidium sp. 392]|nr:hypothetical protein FRC07_006135 [Ceratobasidium sp. 392]
MGPNLFRFFTTVKRSNASEASKSTVSLPKAVEKKPAGADPLDNQPHPLFKKIQQTWDNRFGEWTEIQRAQLAKAREIPTNTKIIAYNRKDTVEGNNDHIWVEFRSPTLIDLLRAEFEDVSDLLGYNPGLDARLIYNKLERLQTCIRDRSFTGVDLNFEEDSEQETTYAEDMEALQLLLDYIGTQFEDVTSQLDILLRQQKEGHITWNLLWTLCEKGKRMQASDPGTGEPIAFELNNWGYKEKSEKKSARFKVYGHYIQWTGYQFANIPIKYRIEHFPGARQLDKLPFQPLLENTKQELIGHTIREEHRASSRKKTSHWRVNLAEDDPDLCLLPPDIHGWSFRHKGWDTFLVTHLVPIDFNKDAFGHLVLQEKYKRLVVAFVNAHTRKDKKSSALISDVVKGKGGGMVMLLHGSPGTGKTLTAEAVADHLQRPLYAISCGELAFQASSLESQLYEILDIAAGWNCVVLIDEADIFLQARNNDIERSALVSVFLRVLEYHNGVLILTTNRVETFDEAFQSRISISLKYPDLDQASRKVLWKKFLTFANAITPENSEIWEQQLDKLSERVMNGRDIKNTVRSAQTLSFEEKTPLDPSHVELVLSISDEFARALKTNHV